MKNPIVIAVLIFWVIILPSVGILLDQVGGDTRLIQVGLFILVPVALWLHVKLLSDH